MGRDYLNLPGDCFVNNIKDISNGITLSAGFLSDFGFHHQQDTRLLITRGHIIITSKPTMCNILSAIEELQLRQDELNQDFGPAIRTLLALLMPVE